MAICSSFHQPIYKIYLFLKKVSLSLCHDLKDLVQEFYRLELVVINDRRSSTSTTSTSGQVTVDSAMSSSATADTSTNNSSNATTNPVGTFFNHHANRFKTKIQTTLNPSSNVTFTLSSPLRSAQSFWSTTKNNVIILANAAAIELYFLCVEDEQDAEKLCIKCSEKFSLNLSLTDTIAQAPLIASCIQVLGRLALKYPNLAKISVRHLSDFLTEPSPILLKQYKHIIEKLNTLNKSTKSPPAFNRTVHGVSNNSHSLR